jgi:hypothetical protein
MSHPLWSKVFEQVRTGEPMLVQRLDRDDRYYWIVPTQDDRGTPRAAVAVDAHTGDYQQALSIRDPQSSLFAFAALEKVREHVLGRRFALPAAAGGAVEASAQSLSVHAPLVWKPCRESMSPFYPFRMITVGAHRLYVRVFDGAVFPALTNDRGGA